MLSRRAWAQLAAAAGLLLLPLLLYVSNERRRYGDVSLYSSPLLSPAPPAQASDFRFTDARGWYQRVTVSNETDSPYVNLVWTKAGFLRSGDVHKCEQLNHIVFGAVKLTTVSRGREKSRLFGGGHIVKIPPHTPHLYTYLQDTLMTETWRRPDGSPCRFEAWFYKPLRNRIPSNSTEKEFVGTR